MEVSFSSSFKKTFKKKIKSTELEADFWLKLELFINDPFNIQLKTHKLSENLKIYGVFRSVMICESFFTLQKTNPKKRYWLI